jgi:copper(I)-binding protein
MRSKSLLLVLLLAINLAFAYAPPMAKNINISNAEVKFAIMGPRGEKNVTADDLSTEVKLTLDNQNPKTVTLIAASSPIAEKVQLHDVVKKEKKEVMQPIEEIKLAGQHKTQLSFKGQHIMLINLKKHLLPQETIPITLIFADGSHKTISAQVTSP